MTRPGVLVSIKDISDRVEGKVQGIFLHSHIPATWCEGYSAEVRCQDIAWASKGAGMLGDDDDGCHPCDLASEVVPRRWTCCLYVASDS